MGSTLQFLEEGGELTTGSIVEGSAILVEQILADTAHQVFFIN